MKKLLLLGGARPQIPLINTAHKMGYYVITCDYLPDNPGHKLADESYNVSTTDLDGVLNLARNLKIDGIVCFASDPAAPTAAYISEKMGLPTSPYNSVNILTHKDLFRDFLAKNGFKTPLAIGFSEHEYSQAVQNVKKFSYPFLIKPVDSSGSKGITIVRREEDIKTAVSYALSFSRCKRFLFEEYIEKKGYQVAGDGFSVAGNLSFYCFANDHFHEDIDGNYIPVGESFPYVGGKGNESKVFGEIQRALKLLNMKTQAYNFEARINRDGAVYLMEIGPRSGGNAIPQATAYATGTNMIEYVIKAAMGEDCHDIKMAAPKGYWGTYMLHSNSSGTFRRIEMKDGFDDVNLVEMDLNLQPGERVEEFTGANKAIGTMICKFSSEEEMLSKMDNMEKWVKPIVD